MLLGIATFARVNLKDIICVSNKGRDRARRPSTYTSTDIPIAVRPSDKRGRDTVITGASTTRTADNTRAGAKGRRSTLPRTVGTKETRARREEEETGHPERAEVAI